MTPLIISLTTMFIWLLKETDWLRVNLMPRLVKGINLSEIKFKTHNYLCQSKTCGGFTPIRITLIGEFYRLPKWFKPIPENEYARQFDPGVECLDIHGYKIKTPLVCPDCIAELKTEIDKAQSPVKPRFFRASQLPLGQFVEEVTTGSHWKREHWTDAWGKKHQQNTIVRDSKTIFHDCLPGKKWLGKHHQDTIPEPTMELFVDGELKATVNGNYKRGTIKQLIKQEV